MKYITAEKDRSMLRRRIFGWKSGLWNLAGKISVRLGFLALISTRPMLTYKRHQALKGKTVLIYSMGKVGSSSIYYTLMRCFPFSRVHHNHFLSDEWIENRLPGTPFTRNIRLARAAHADISKAKGEFLYIVLMRDPVARDLSNIIQNYQNMSIDIFADDIEDSIKKIRENGHFFFAEWFDTEFANHFGFPVTDLSFDKERGWSVIQIDSRRRILLLTAESLDRAFNDSLFSLLGVEVDTQFRFNSSDDKLEAEFYTSLRDKYSIPAQKAESIYGHEIVDFFYSEGAVKRFKEEWTDK